MWCCIELCYRGLDISKLPQIKTKFFCHVQNACTATTSVPEVHINITVFNRNNRGY